MRVQSLSQDKVIISSVVFTFYLIYMHIATFRFKNLLLNHDFDITVVETKEVEEGRSRPRPLAR